MSAKITTKFQNDDSLLLTILMDLASRINFGVNVEFDTVGSSDVVFVEISNNNIFWLNIGKFSMRGNEVIYQQEYNSTLPITWRLDNVSDCSSYDLTDPVGTVELSNFLELLVMEGSKKLPKMGYGYRGVNQWK